MFATFGDPPAAGRAPETPKERVLRLVAEGKLPPAAVERAEQIWRERLHAGVLMPNGETARLTVDDVYHHIVDPRIWRQPERIERLLHGVAQIREAKVGRRRALSQWQEGEQELLGYAILEESGRVRTLHMVRPSEFRRLSHQGDQLWP